MLRSEFIQLAHWRATGKPTAPSSGSKKYNQIVLSGKYYTRQLSTEPGVDWASRYDYRNSGTISATDTFELDDEILKVSQQEGDVVRILHTDGVTETEYELVPIDRLRENRYNKVVAVNGRNLMFSSPFTSTDPEFGGTLVVPGYGEFEWPESDTGEIDVDDPDWLVDMCAAEFVRNDITRKAEYPNLLGSASERLRKMKENNGQGVDEIYRPNFFASDEVY